MLGEKVTVTALELPWLIVTGKVVPVIENAAPLTVAELTVSVAVPGFEIVIVRVAEVFTVMLPKPIVAGDTAICATTPVVAVPVSETTVGELAALLMKDTEPLMGPADEGVTVIETLMPLPAETVAGNAKPGTPKLASLVFTAVITASVLPELVKATVREAVVPTNTEPKSADAGMAAKLAGVLCLEDEGVAPVLPQPASTTAANATATVAMHRSFSFNI